MVSRSGSAATNVPQRTPTAWEYCVVSTQNGEEYIEYWESGGADRKMLKKEPDGTYQYVRSVIARLGENSWELVGTSGSLLYFKRAKQS